ncbi:MAG: hypothetical protein BGN88_03910 [Clostridiales bacterium 43-6]|nr:MAG: hypothetical protein BGN88_03910 [Clostridiales bacterium 43-6]
MENNNFENNVQYAPPAPPAGHPKKGFAIASLVLGLVSVVISCFIYVAVPAGIIGIILGALALKAGKNGMAMAGLVLSIIGIVFSIVLIAGVYAILMGASNAANAAFFLA